MNIRLKWNGEKEHMKEKKFDNLSFYTIFMTLSVLSNKTL